MSRAVLFRMEAMGEILAPRGRPHVCICTECSDLVGVEPLSERPLKAALNVCWVVGITMEVLVGCF